MSKELKQAIEDYADKINKRWINARDSAPRPSDFNAGLEWAYNIIELELREILKEADLEELCHNIAY